MRFLSPLLLIAVLFCASEPPPAKPSGRPGAGQVDDACMRQCMRQNAARAVSGEQIEYDCRLDCAR